jgi:predicted amidohydrolase
MKPLLSRRQFAALAAAASAAPPPASAARSGPRHVWVGAITMDELEPRSKDEANQLALARLDRFASSKPDIVCLPETFHLAAIQPAPAYAHVAEPVPGPTTDRFGVWARDHNCWVICPLHERHEGRIHNTAVVLDRSGKVAGQYRKLHVVESEMEAGASCGRNAPVPIDAGFAKIGIQICFDVNWPEGWSALKRVGAEMVFWPSAYPGGRALYPLAWRNIYPIVSVPWRLPGVCEIIDIAGDVAASSGRWQPWLCAPVNLEKGLFHTDFQDEKAHAIEAKYGRGVRLHWYHLEHWFALEVLDPALSLARLKAEFGLVPLDDYLARAEKAQRANGAAI